MPPAFVSMQVLLWLFTVLSPLHRTAEVVRVESKLDGTSFVGPNESITPDRLQPIREIESEWIAVLPYAFSYSNKPQVSFDSRYQWWGERTEGVTATIRYAQEHQYKVMLKPHVWVLGQGWMGDYSLDSEEAWRIWERDYTSYILHYARIAASMKVELFCIGTEARYTVRERPAFWRALIDTVRQVYPGELTYAANWDNYEQVPFWDELDYIGIDAYFPLSEEKTPTVQSLVKAWEKPFNALHKLSNRHAKPVLFTEFGYMSVDGAAGKNWELEQSIGKLQVNHQAQVNAYEALFRKFWEQDWFAGGFLWKWYHYHEKAGGLNNKDYTPQNKPVADLIRRYYSEV